MANYNNPLQVDYKDLIESCERALAYMEANYPGKVLAGTMKSWAAQHAIAVEKAKLKLFRKFKKEPSIDLADQHEKNTNNGKPNNAGATHEGPV